MSESYAGELENFCQHPTEKTTVSVRIPLWPEFVFCSCLVIGVTLGHRSISPQSRSIQKTPLAYHHSDSMAPVKIIHRTKSPSLSLYQIVERSGHKGNWANRNRGVVLVFCIVFLVVVGVMALFAYRRMLQRKAKKESYETTSD
ncbi:hypothetical protein ACN38_g9659 [Penicillium nordicum]|uniref:Uncharacterized protein n=1 Tax=Penicillium nordicum TaxID=229535 RepID=A0A0M8P2T5_9EURO|nr:hypothetical protein ACN38_g9659 [Penicillium nordicum]